MAHFLDSLPFDWTDPAARELRNFLASSYFREAPVVQFAQAAGVQPATVAWGRPKRAEAPPAPGAGQGEEPPAAAEPDPEPALQKVAAGQTAAEQGERVSRYLEEVEGDRWNDALSEVFRGDADQAAFEL